MEHQTVMDTMTSDVSKPNDVMNLLQLNTSDDGQVDMANNLELFNAALASAETETTSLMESQSTIELNGERHVIVQETTDPETGELLVVLKSENGNHIALPSSVIHSGIVQMAAENQLEVIPQQELEQQQPRDLPQDLDQVMQQETHQEEEQELQPIVQQDLQQVIQQEMKGDEPVLDTNVNPDITVNGVPEDTPVLETTALNSEIQSEVFDGQVKLQQDAPEGATVAIIEDDGITTQETIDGQTVFTADAASLEALVANAMASGATGGQDFVIMTEEAPTIEAINTTESIEVGQGDGTAIYAEQVVDNSTTQYVASNGSTEEMILNAMSQSGTLSDGQVIHAVVDEQTFAYTITATESGFQLIPMGPVTDSPRSSPKKSSPVARPQKAKPPSGETLLVASARTEMVGSGAKKRQAARAGTKPNPFDNQRFMGKAVAIDSDSPSLLTATAPGPSQLASSRRTYSKKNVVWCNPESKSTKAAFSSVSKPVAKVPETPASLPAVVSRTVTSPMKVAPVPTSSSPEKSKFAARATSPAKVPHVPPPKANPILIDDGKPLEDPKVDAAVSESRPKSPTKKENGILVQPVPKAAEEAVEKRGIRSRRATSKSLPEEAQAEKEKEPVEEKEEAKPEAVIEKINQEKERPSRIRKPTAKVAAATTSSKTPSKEEKLLMQEAPVAVVESKAEPAVETPALVRSSRKAKRQEEVKEDQVLDVAEVQTKETVKKTEDMVKEVEKDKIEKEEIKKEEKISRKDEKCDKKDEKTPKKRDEKSVVVEKKDEVSKSEDEQIPVRRSSRAPKRKSIDDDVIVELKVVTSEKRTKPKESEEEKKPCEENKSDKKNTDDKKLEKKAVDEIKVEKKIDPKVKSVVEESSTPRKRVGFSAEVAKSEEPKDAKRRRTASTEKKVTPLKEATPKKATDVKPILKRTPGSALSTPKGRRLETPIVATFSPVDQKAENKLLKDVIESLNDQRSPDQRYDIPSPGCEFHVRHQSVSLSNYTPRGSGSSYACQKCGFRTSRMNNLIIHHKEQCPVVKNAQMMSWKAEIRKQTKTPPSSTVTRRTSELSASSPEEEEGSPVPASSFTPYNPPPTAKALDDAAVSADEEDQALSAEKKMRDQYGFAPKDVVWVQWKNTSWPAVAVSVDVRKREVQARLIDGPERSSRKGIKIALDKVAPFDDAEQNKRLLREGRERENGDLLVKAVQKAEEHLRKQCLGESNLVKVLGDLDADFSDGHSDDDDKPDHSNAISVSNSRSPPDVVDSTDEEALFANAQTMDQWKERRRVQNEKLLQCVKEGKVETHLLGVYTGTIASERHQKFKKESETDKNPVSLAWFGPIDDEEQQEEIYEYCSQLFKSNFKPEGDFDIVAYLFEVWVPEAIMKSISRVRRMEMKEAEEVFERGVVLSKSEKEEIRRETEKQVGQDAPTTSTM